MSYERTIRVVPHGYLKDIFPEPFNMSGFSVAEIITGICTQTAQLNPLPGQGRHSISIPGFDTAEKLVAPISKKVEEIHLVPNMAGGKSGFFQVVLGVILIAVAIWNPAFLSFSFSLFGTSFAFSASSLFSMGLSMLAGGLLQVMSPHPTTQTGNVGSAADPAASKYLGANANTVKVGTRIPLLYGKHIAFGQYLSFDVDAKDVAV